VSRKSKHNLVCIVGIYTVTMALAFLLGACGQKETQTTEAVIINENDKLIAEIALLQDEVHRLREALLTGKCHGRKK
jgi:hypothetical protein